MKFWNVFDFLRKKIAMAPENMIWLMRFDCSALDSEYNQWIMSSCAEVMQSHHLLSNDLQA